MGLITKVVRRAEKTGARGMLVTLGWPGSVFFVESGGEGAREGLCG